jgi:hypothetical protein
MLLNKNLKTNLSNLFFSQSFVTALKEELSDYYQLLTNLETEFLKDENKNLTLHQLCVFTLEPLCR